MALEGTKGGIEEQATFEAMQPELVRRHPGRFAVVCATRLLGVFESVDDALLASSRAFDAGGLPDGAPVLITELAERAAIRVLARPYARTGSALPG